MEIEPVLQALVAEADQASAGVHGTALALENLEDAGSFDAQSKVAFGSGLGLAGLVGLDEEELGRIEAFERAHRARSTVLNRIRQRQGG